MNLYQPTITGSLSISGSVNISGSITIAGGGTISGTASIATNAITASSADNFLVRNTLTAQTLVVQTITSSVDFVTGSTRFGSILGNTHVFSGSVTMNPNGLFVSSSGLVGIGNIVPAYTLDVSGTGRFSGIVGIGVAPSAWYNSSGYATLQVGNASLFGRNSANSELYLSSNAYDNTSGNPTYITTDFAARYVQNDGVHSWLTAPSGTAGTATTFTERMRITQAGNVGIGTDSPVTKLDIVAGGDAIALALRMRSQDDYSFLQFKNFAGTQVISEIYSNRTADNTGSLIFTTNNGGVATERMRISSDGRLFVGTSSIPSGFFGSKLNILADADNGITVKTTTVGEAALAAWSGVSSGDNLFQLFYTETSRTQKGSIFYSRSNGQVRFDGYAAGTYSDERLKDIKGECSYGLDTISKMKVYDFDWLRNSTKGFGVKAQELYKLVPEVVEIGNDGQIDPQEFDYRHIWKVNYNELVPVLIKAIQEQQAQIQNLQEQINILQTK